MSNSEDSGKFVRNMAMTENERSIRSLRHIKYADWQPEYERLGKTPIERNEVSKDFMYSKRKFPVALVGSKPKQTEERSAVLPPMPIGFGTKEKDANSLEFQDKEIPYPPQGYSYAFWDPKGHHSFEPEPEQEPELTTSEINMTFDDVSDGDYCVMIDDKIIVASSVPEEIEEFLNETVFITKTISLDDVTVLRKLRVKIGASLDEL